jgi:hypothetical protein
MTDMSEIDLVRRVQHVEKRAGLKRVERQGKKGNRDKGARDPRRFEKELENHQTAGKIDITV